jgi:IS605 OrfB family transposase
MIKTYKYRLKDRSARKHLRVHATACNQVWNWCVAQQRDIEARYRAGAPKRKWLSAFDLAKQCKGVGADLGLHQQTVQSLCEQFARSRDQHKRCPKFRSSFGLSRALGWVPFQRQSRQVSGSSITYLGHRYRFFGNKRRSLPESTKGGFFVEDTLGRWYVCFHVEVEQAKAETGEVGIDLGLKSFAALNTGEVVEAPRIYRQLEARLAVAQRSKNARRVKAIHARIKNIRNDFHHKLSTRLSCSYALIAVGDVNAKALSRTRFAKSVLDAGWSAFRSMLKYKASTFVEVDEKFTTQTCSSCGALPPERPKGIAGLGLREWECSSCGVVHDRDVNAARNILALGRSVTPLAEESRRAA